MTAKPLKQKIIEIDLTLSTVGDTFGPSKGNTLHVQGLACDVTVDKVGFPTKNSATVEIYNMKQSDIEKITTTNHRTYEVKKNIMKIYAYEEGGTKGEVFVGEIFLAYGIFNSPDLGVHIEAITGIYDALKATEPLTHEGEIDGIELIKKCTNEMEGYSFSNPVPLPKMFVRDPVLNGSNLDKIYELGRILNIQVLNDDMVIKVLPWTDPLPGKAINVSAKTGMIGYPAFNSNGIQLYHEYRPEFMSGGAVKVESLVPKASGVWKIIKMTHTLQSFGAGPNWTTFLDCIYPEAGGIRNG